LYSFMEISKICGAPFARSSAVGKREIGKRHCSVVKLRNATPVLSMTKVDEGEEREGLLSEL